MLATAEAACREAGTALRARTPAGLAVRTKGDFEQVSDADVAAERALRAALCAAVPGSAVVGEELAGRPHPGVTGVTWYVDPIDGTHNFLRGLPLACVSVGVAVAGELVGGCVLDVGTGECFTGGVGLPLRVNGEPPAPPPAAERLPLVLTDIPLTGRTDQREVDLLRDLIARADVRRLYTTALSLAWVAAGRAELACNLGIRPWDVAGGAALVRAAGGTYTPVGGADPVAAPGFLAARSGLPPAGEELRRWLRTRLGALSPGAPVP